MTNKILHILWSGSKNGGAQKFSSKLADEVAVTTCSLKRGDLEEYLNSQNKKFQAPEFNIYQLKNKFEILLLSDTRALIYYAIFFLKFRNIPGKYFIPHHDKLCAWPYSWLIKAICYLFSIIILPTTRVQKEFFNSEDWYKLYDYEINAEQIIQKNKTIIYFGRISNSKRIKKILSILQLNRFSQGGGNIKLVGFENKHTMEPYLTFKDIQLIPWLEDKELKILLEGCAFSINGSKCEGISLQSLEAINNGIIPLFLSKQMAYNLYLPFENTVISNRLLQRVLSPNPIILDLSNLKKALNQKRKISDLLKS